MLTFLLQLRRRYVLLPFFALPLPMIVLHRTASHLCYDPPWLLFITNTLFVGCVSLLVAVIAARNYQVSGRIKMLLLGSAMLSVGVSAILAGIVRGLPGGANLNVTIYNCAALLGALLHAFVAFILAAGLHPQTAPRRRPALLACSYGLVILFIALLVLGTMQDVLPLFFVQGTGATLIRQVVLGSVIVLNLFSFTAFLATYQRNREPFLLWYAGALGLTATGMAGFFLQHSVGSPVGWVGRFSLYLGELYFLAALLVADRSARRTGESFDDVLVLALNGTDEKIRSAFAHATIGFAMATVKGRFIDVNPAFTELTGYTLTELQQVGQAQLIHPDDRAENMELARRMLGGELPNFTVENRYLRKGGDPIWVRKSVSLVRDSDGTPRWMVALIEDVTQRKEVERQLAGELDTMTRLQKLSTLFVHDGNLQSVLEEVVDAAIAITGADFGNIQLMDPATGDLVIVAQRGFPQWWIDYWQQTAQGKGTCGASAAIGQRIVVEDVEQSDIFVGTDALEIQRRAGVRAVQSTPLLSRSGELVGMFSTHYRNACRPDEATLRRLDLLSRQTADTICRLRADEALRLQAMDLQESRQEALNAQDALRLLNQELEQRVQERTVKLTAINKELESFCYSVAHELGSPLRSMNCFSAIVLEEYGERMDPEGRNYLERIAASASRMGHLVEGLLLLSRVTRREMVRETINLSEMVGEIVNELVTQEPKRRVETEVAEGSWGQFDPALAKLALYNLLGNAWKYTSRVDGAKIEFGHFRRGGESVYYVRDNGIGFDMAYAHKIFLPFERLEATAKFDGTGIGLATVQRVIEMHGGKVWAESEPGSGATFYFTEGLGYAY
ncbi:PAS domain S-box protein [Geomonas oryzisoli]|uniref:histidine kinase n=1 Tax=Geomonas oryzisoli TaxID=2847992 RepID=A0ABX8J5J3_9BACT|nr:PAS domain S-box protein [Geomonas oryzisoli]QWV93276.1 PAS domain S-box protein [Geomonas oryzisoli]